MLQKKIMPVFLLVLLLLPTLVFAQNGSALKRIIKAGELRVGTSGAQPPFTATDKNGELMGFEIDLARDLADAMGVGVVFVKTPFPDLLSTLAKGEVDIVMSGMTITPERNVRAAFVGPYLVSGKSILTSSRKVDNLDELEKLNRPSVTVAVLKNSTSQRFVERHMPKAKHVKAADYEDAVRMVLDNKADLMVADYPVCALSMLRHPEADLVILEELLTVEPIGLAMPADNFQLHNLIENYLSALQMTGALEDLEVQWFDNADWLIRLP